MRVLTKKSHATEFVDTTWKIKPPFGEKTVAVIGTIPATEPGAADLVIVRDPKTDKSRHMKVTSLVGNYIQIEVPA